MANDTGYTRMLSRITNTPSYKRFPNGHQKRTDSIPDQGLVFFSNMQLILFNQQTLGLRLVSSSDSTSTH